MSAPSLKPKVKNAKSAVMRPAYRKRVERDRTKYSRKGKQTQEE